MNRTLKATAVLMLMMVFAAGCGKQPIEPQKQAPEGAVDGLFSISENKQVYFSQGNLQYQPSSNSWQFAWNQYDCIERNDYLQIDENYDEWIDAFAWGTSGNNHGAVCYQPWASSENDGDYYAYGDSVANLYDHSGQADWGNNRILNGGNQIGLWRTLTKDEWEYIFDKRATTSGARFAHAVVNNAFGIILFPDDWDPTVYSFVEVNRKTIFSPFTTNVISETDWNALHYQYGLVLLPIYQRGCAYWSSNYNDKNDEYGLDCALEIGTLPGFIFVGTSEYRHNKCYVRLVQDAD